MTRTVEPSRANVTEGGCLVARIPHNEKVQVHDAYFCLNSNDPMFQSRCCRCPQLTYRATLQRCVQRSSLPAVVNTTQATCIADECCRGIPYYAGGRRRRGVT
ncbi:uncharacterized protein LOC135392727 isoform X4 [Ornithodoros turicata]|uniref:uncharacterized protein LOC135392727 isoform X4 n=1 Tax=Ornithodoros turicata TaxID=34597 RepID=UPI003139DFA0